MEKKKLFCKKASELKSFEELKLPKELIDLFSSIGICTGEIICRIRYSVMSEEMDIANVSFWTHLANDYDLGFAFEKFPEFCRPLRLDYDGTGTKWFHAIRKSLLNANFLREKLRVVYYIAEYYTNHLEHYSWLTCREHKQLYFGFNEFYETLEVDEPISKILEILKGGLPATQYQMAKFDIENSTMQYDYVTREEWSGTYYSNKFQLTGQDYYNLMMARDNSKSFLKNKIINFLP